MTAERLTVGDDEAGERLDVFLASHAGSRAAAQKLIDAGLVTVDGRKRPKRHVLGTGETVAVAAGEPVEEPEVAPAKFRVAYEDEHVLVVDKPAGVIVHPGKGNTQGTLAQALAGRSAGGPDAWRQGIVHRLDRDTSGLLVTARRPAAWERLSDMIRAREVTREYLALVDGRPPARYGTIDAPIGRDRRVRTRHSTDTDEPREAVTHFSVERALPECTLLRVRLETGRTHQIRAHLQAIGHPVLGDPEYGVPRLGLQRQFLHAEHLAFAHPVTGEAIDLRSPLPDDLAEALERAAQLHSPP
jgi:23S rRNA pseudouridine1911/1915/1917 synthase